MLIIKIKGGLGNQLFQYALGRFLQITKGKEVYFVFPKNETREIFRPFELENFNTKITFLPKNQTPLLKTLLSFIAKIKIKIFRNFNTGYNPNVINQKNAYLDGFWQTYKYSDYIRDHLLAEITLKKQTGHDYEEILAQITSSNSVSLHIRRGDYVSDPKTKKMHDTFGMEYYQEALKIIDSKINQPTYFVFSDDIGWVKENLKTNGQILFVSSYGLSASEELMLMGKCQHNIIANSSFSWWGAWLNKNPKKIVIAPKKWFNNLSIDINELIPESWTKI